MEQLPIEHKELPPLSDRNLRNRHIIHHNLAEIHRRAGNIALENFHRAIAEQDLAELVVRQVIQAEQYGDVDGA